LPPRADWCMRRARGVGGIFARRFHGCRRKMMGFGAPICAEGYGKMPWPASKMLALPFSFSQRCTFPAHGAAPSNRRSKCLTRSNFPRV
jgi:hypothetical protein